MHIRKGLALLLVTLFVASVLPAPAAATPVTSSCNVAGLSGSSSASADQYDPALCQQLTGRVFPEGAAHDDYVNGPNGFTGAAPYVPATDYVGYFEFQQGLDYLASQYPEYIEVHQVASSYGLTNALGGPENLPIYMLEISNEESPVPRDEKLNLLFMLSIHGNEKGGREGGFRVLEDLLRNVGFATESVQQGAGLPDPIEKPTGGTVETYRDYLDFMNIFLLFPNSDGWACDEVEFAATSCPALFTRGNGRGTDLNRQTPTIGWHNPGRQVMGEPESGGVGTEYSGFGNWLVEQREQNESFAWNYAIDIHGMPNHKNFGAIMLPAGSMTPQEMHRSLRLAETLKERWNADPHYSAWRTLFQTEEAAYDNTVPATEDAFYTACETANPMNTPHCPLVGSALYTNPGWNVGSSQFAEYYTVIDAIGYTDSGFNGDFFAQTTGLNAPGYDIELAYNHLNCGAGYQIPGCALFNDYHVWMVRGIVKSFMDAAALDVQISYETDGLRTAYVPTPYVSTNLDDVDAEGNPRLTPGGWADQNAGDDKWDYGADQPFQAYSTKYWDDIRPFVCEGCGTASSVAGVMEARRASQLTADSLANFDNLVISGSAINDFFTTGAYSENSLPMVDADTIGDVDAAKLQAIVDWVEAGGNLILTDAALSFFDLAGITNNAVEREFGYMGGIRMDLNHEMLNKIRGGVKQTYEPTPLGFGTSGAAPNWGIDPTAFNALDGNSVAGLVCSGSSLNQNCAGRNIALGYVDMGQGRIQFMGSVLPDATEEFYHPYGLDDYATTYSANQIVRNMLGWDEVFASPPVTVNANGVQQSGNEPVFVEPTTVDAEQAAKDKKSPGVGLVALVGAVALAFLVRRRA